MTHRISKSTISALLLSLVFLGCNDAPILLDGDDLGQHNAAVVNGSVDNGHPAIGALHSGNKAACTATLIGKRTVLTAAHCVTEKDPPYAKLSPVNFYIGKIYTGTKYTAVANFVHPSYAGGNKADVAVLRLDREVTGVTPIPIAMTSPAKGETIIIVGYGKTGESGAPFGTKRKASNTISSLSSTTYSMYGASGGTGNVCNGDSGGPSLATRKGIETVVGVHSTKLNYCGWGATDMRVDTYYSWIYSKAQGDIYSGGPLDTEAPQVSITSPGTGATVDASFKVKVAASDDVGVTRVVLYLNAQKVGERTSAPFEFNVSNVNWGSHTLEAVARDAAQHSASTSISITVKSPQSSPPKPLGGSCDKNTDCGSQVCVGGGVTSGYCSRKCGSSSQCPGGYSCSNTVCVKKDGNGGNGRDTGGSGNNGGGSTPQKGGYGASCDGPASCATGLCALDSATGKRFCTSLCDLNAASSCAADSTCQPAGGGKAVCAPLHNPTSGTDPVLNGGCSVTGGGNGALLPLALLALLVLMRRRTRRA